MKNNNNNEKMFVMCFGSHHICIILSTSNWNKQKKNISGLRWITPGKSLKHNIGCTRLNFSVPIYDLISSHNGALKKRKSAYKAFLLP